MQNRSAAEATSMDVKMIGLREGYGIGEVIH